VRVESEDSASGPIVEAAAPAGRVAGWWRRALTLLSRWPVIAVGVAISVLGWILVGRTAPCSDFHFGAQFSGSDEQLRRWIGDCGYDLTAARRTLLADGVLIAGYVIAATGMLARWWPLYRAPRLQRMERVVVLLPVAAAVLDVLENVMIAIWLESDGENYRYPDNFAPTLISTLAWVKMLVYGAGILCVFAVIMLAIARLRDKADVQPAAIPEIQMEELPRPRELGICCSGGGIRAAAFAMGAIESLEQAGVMQQARWLTAVSGGNYAATAWTLARAADPSRPAATDVIDWLNTPIPYSKSGRHRFLRNGPGGLGRSIIAALAYIALNLLVLGALVAAVAWPIGRLIGSKAIQGQWHSLHGLPATITTRSELWLPGVTVFAVAAVVFLSSALPSWRTSRWWRLAVLLVVVGVALELLTVVFPWAMWWVGDWVRRGDRFSRARTAGFATLLAALAVVWRVVRRPVTTWISRKLPYLGGVLLGLVAVAWAGKVAVDAATGTGLLPSWRSWVALVAGFAVVYLFLGMTQPSIHRIYRKRLRRSFGLGRDATGALYSPHQRDQITWDQLPDSNPELIVCCAHQRDGIAPGGLPADTFTISPRRVCIGDYCTSTSRFLARLPKDLECERAVSSWMATSGAAFASAMGRMSRGTTNALMAALNIDLGIWLPNPRLTSNPDALFPKVRFGYLFKEILGWYDDTDRYVFVADGGHWDNLGLVELLRRRCSLIICLDASGDDVGRFTTLHQAIELAGLELPEIVASIDTTTLSDLIGVDGALPKCSVTALQVHYTAPRVEAGTGAAEAGPTGTILYAKAQLAADLDISLRRYSKVDPTFPNYSTARLFLRDDQFRSLVALGRAAGARLATMIDDPAPAPPTPESVAATIVATAVTVSTSAE
jgi:hypothetical protein